MNTPTLIAATDGPSARLMALEEMERRYDTLPHGVRLTLPRSVLTLPELHVRLAHWRTVAATAAARLAEARIKYPDGGMVDSYARQLTHAQKAIAQVEGEIAARESVQQIAAE